MESSAPLSDLIRTILEESDESARAYLRARWLTRASRSLQHARHRAGLSQREVAERLGTAQSAIARMENDHDGRVTLRRYIDFLLACDQMPVEITSQPVVVVRKYAIADFEDPLNQEAPREV